MKSINKIMEDARKKYDNCYLTMDKTERIHGNYLKCRNCDILEHSDNCIGCKFD